MIIDVDTHWERARYARGEHPLEPWRNELPSPRMATAEAICLMPAP